MAQRHPPDPPSSNPHGTPPPTRHAEQQSPWHSGTHATRRAAIPMAQRHPRDPPSSNPHGTAPPTRPAEQQSAWHSGTHATRPAAIPMAQRHPRDTPRSNPHGTAPPTRHAQEQSPWHSGTHATRPAAIPMAQRHPRDTPRSNPHGTAPHTAHAPRARSADPHGTELTTHRDATRDDARRPSGHTANEANTGPAPRPPDYKREPFATHSGKKTIVEPCSTSIESSGYPEV